MKNDIKQKKSQSFSDVEFERSCESVNVKNEVEDCSL